MKKNFAKSLGNKNLSSLIPTDDIPVKEKEAVVPKAKSVKSVQKKKKETPSAKTPKTKVTTFRINQENLKSIKAIAFWDRRNIQEVLNEALNQYINSIPASTLKKAVSEFEKRS